jgi:hypothetical protein
MRHILLKVLRDHLEVGFGHPLLGLFGGGHEQTAVAPGEDWLGIFGVVVVAGVEEGGVALGREVGVGEVGEFASEGALHVSVRI